MREISLGKYIVVINEETFQVFKEFRQLKSDQNESGGILMGQVKEKYIYILRASIPSSCDKATRYSFERNRLIAQIIINYEFWNSGKTNMYLGEWHTHPENHPTPSRTDEIMIKSQLRENQLCYPFIIQCIIGQKLLYMRLLTKRKRYLGNLKL